MKKTILNRLVSACSAAAVMCSVGGYMSTDHASAYEADITDFSISDVAVTDDYCTNALNKELEYLLSFDTEKLLAGFRDNAGLSTNGATRYGGWENTNIAGHCVGHYLTALAQAYQRPDISSNKGTLSISA
ncbi:MAG TPA: glycoside hydrolase family 127 protein [Ruminococcus flavefaciens]|nr:glycoside hydrolase family 127 protein [Ruminococcus flavefaciens]